LKSAARRTAADATITSIEMSTLRQVICNLQRTFEFKTYSMTKAAKHIYTRNFPKHQCIYIRMRCTRKSLNIGPVA
jgi:hypothetical protein